jgi:2-dehydropantoate 2-reductase
MRICVVGAGAIGGYLGAQLALAGEDVTLVARGAQLAALQQGKLRVRARGGEEKRAPKVTAVSSIAGAGGSFDLVILSLKAHQIPAIAPELPSLFGPETAVLAIQNGVPWWYFQKHGGRFEGSVLESVDPGGLISRHVAPERIVGVVVWLSTSVPEPGLIEYTAHETNRFILGEIDDAPSARVDRLIALLTKAGVKAERAQNIRMEKWKKLMGSLVFSPLSCLAHATQPQVCQVPATRRLAVAMMSEAIAIAASLGLAIDKTAESRVADVERANKDNKSSMRQDMEAGRELEVDAQVGAVLEMGQISGTAAPNIEAVYACAKLLSETIAQRRVRVISQKLA